MAIFSPFRMKCARVVTLYTGSLRLLHQPRSPAARLVSSQAGGRRNDVKIQYLLYRPDYPAVRGQTRLSKKVIKDIEQRSGE